ncbi:MAG: hypothetical protein J3K34DRAFT_405336 [Monoraphidium minutum]|nr:MAG: hypothetical protein J3K34DRAFT_405336 [Monoraphidium minutum]
MRGWSLLWSRLFCTSACLLFHSAPTCGAGSGPATAAPAVGAAAASSCPSLSASPPLPPPPRVTSRSSAAGPA